MKIALFARVNAARNPYILLYKAALEQQKLVVHLEREFNLRWLLSWGKSYNVIHLHWIEASYKPVKRNFQYRLAGKLINNGLYSIIRGGLRLTNFTAALILAKLQQKIIVYTVHNLNRLSSEIEFSPFIILNRVANHIIFFLSDQIHIHNHYTRKMLETTYKRNDGVTIVPHGNYIGCYPNKVSQLEARRQLGLHSKAFVYLFLGQLRPYKGLENLVEAFEQLEWPTARLLIAGPVSKSKTRYQETLLCRARNNPAIKLVPEFIPDEALQFYMNSCNVYVLPYKDITTSGAALLALSFGRPIIAPAIASLPELITPETGILYDPSQPDALVSALQKAKQQSWSEAEIFDYAHQFDWDKLGPQLAALYQTEASGQRQTETTSKRT